MVGVEEEDIHMVKAKFSPYPHLVSGMGGVKQLFKMVHFNVESIGAFKRNSGTSNACNSISRKF